MSSSIDEFWQYAERLLSREINQVNLQTEAPLSMALVFPNYYEVAMANLGFQSLYRLFNSCAGVRCERAFLYKPFPDIARTLETISQLSFFDVIAFSTSFEMDYLHVAKILANTGLQPLSHARHPRDPLIIAGGTATFINPTPIAPFMDLLFLGEIEPFLEQFVEELRLLKDYRYGKHETLRRLSHLDGVYVPQIHDAEKKRISIAVHRDKANPQFSPVVTPDSHFQNMFLIETGRGCGRYCHFCAASHVYHPLRYFPEEKILSTIEHNIQSAKKVGLVGAALCDHPQLTSLCKKLVDAGYQLGLSSFRFDAITSEFLDIIQQGGVSAITLAPEAGTARLRQIINKSLSDVQIFGSLELISQTNIANLKLYFLIGLPFETQNDLQGIVETVRKARAIYFANSRQKKEITISVNAFVPKPFTPFQWWGMDNEKMIKNKRRFIESELHKITGIKISKKNAKLELVQGLLSMGDSSLVNDLMSNDFSRLPAAFTSSTSSEILHRERQFTDPFPWDFIDYPVSKAKLWKAWQKAKEQAKFINDVK